MPSAHKGAISFGLVHIPISLHTATQDTDVRFNQLCKDDLSRVKYKKTCASCGKEVTTKDIVKGFEYEKDKYVIVTDDDFEKIKSEKDKSIQILQFADLSSIKPIYYDKTYHAIPEVGGEKAFELLRVAMKRENKIAIAKTVLGQKETLMALLPTDDGILIETMFYQDEIKELPKEITHPEVGKAELDMAVTLINSMDKDFDAAAYHDEYQTRLKELIAQKIAGKEIVSPAAEKQDNVIDLMEALKASIAQNEASLKPKRKRATTKKEKGA